MANNNGDISIDIVQRDADQDLQPTSQLTIRFHSPLLRVEVVRTYEATLAVIQELQGGSSDVSAGLPTELCVAALESAIREVFTARQELVDEPWNCAAFITFLDGAPLSDALTSTTVTLLKNKVKELDGTLKATVARTNDLQAKYEELAGLVQSMLDPVHPQQARVIAEQSVDTTQTAHEQADAAPIDAVRAALSVSTISEGDGVHFPTPSNSFYVSAADTTQVLSTVASPTDHTSSEAAISPVSSAPTSKFNPAAPVFNPKGAAVTTGRSGRSDELPSSSLLAATQYTELPHEEGLNRAAGEFVLALCPQQAQVAYRDSVVALLQKNFRAALNCEALEVGLHRLLCFLPDDAVKVSAVLCRNHSTKWHRIICDRLNAIAKKRVDQEAGAVGGNGESFPFRPASAGGGAVDDEDSCGEHVIRNVLISNTKLSIQVQCSIDNCEVELSCNSRADVCMLALLEEMAALVGKGDLFKQSLMLIRAWWCCETASYVGTTVKNYLSDLSLGVMVCAIFNVHHARIHSPLQALCAFLAEYSTYDGTTHAITIQGIVPFKSASSVQPVLPSPLNPVIMGGPASAHTADPANSSMLLTREILEKYWLLICPPDSTNPEQQQQQQRQLLPNLSSSSEDVFGIDLRGVPNVNINLDVGVSVTEPREPTLHDEASTRVSSLEDAALAAHRQQCLHNLVKFDRSQFNIVDPFSCHNMVLERPSQNRILRLTKVFQAGAAHMADLLAQAQGAGDGHLDSAALLRSFFPMSFAWFVDSSARPDTFNFDASRLTPNMLAQMTRRIPMTVPVDELHRQMRYCNLMVESVISRTAVLDLVVEILTQKGPLPIGEVGKALAELTCISGLSTRLKEAYGGLKKFLEDFSSVVIIGTDHPFNPHIVLRSSLSPENLALNDSGVFPTHAVLRMKKVSATSLRRNAQQGHMPPNAPLARPGVPAPMSNVPLHQQSQQGYRPGVGAMTTAGIGMNSGAGRQPYPDPRLGGAAAQGQQQQHMHPPYGHHQVQQQHQQQQAQHQGHQAQQGARYPSNMHLDARDREREHAAYRTQQQHGAPAHPHSHSQFTPQQQQLQGMGLHAPLERHGSGSSTSQSHNSSANLFEGFSSTAPSVGSGDAFDEVMATMPAPISPSGVNYGAKPFAPPAYPVAGQQQQQRPAAQQQQQRPAAQQPQYTDQYGFDANNRSRGDSFASVRSGNYPPTHSGNPSSLTGHGYQPHQGFSQQQQPLSAQGGQYGGSPRDRFSTGSPHSFAGMDSSFFDNSAGPILSEPLSLNDGPRVGGGLHQRGNSFGSASGIGIGEGLDGASTGPSRSRLLSGLREGTFELETNPSGNPGAGRSDWDIFNAPLSQDFLGGADWRGQPQGQAERRF